MVLWGQHPMDSPEVESYERSVEHELERSLELSFENRGIETTSFNPNKRLMFHPTFRYIRQFDWPFKDTNHKTL